MKDIKENSNLELKEQVDLSNKKEKQNLIYEVISFLNSHSGVIYIGIDDTGKVIGLKTNDIDKYLLTVQNLIKDNINPSILGLLDFEIESMESKEVIKITILPGDQKPYFYKNKGMTTESVYIRVGVSKEQVTQSWIDDELSSRRKLTLTDIKSPIQKLKFKKLLFEYENKKGINNKESMLENLGFLKDSKFNMNAFLFSDEFDYAMKIAIFDSAGDLKSSKKINEDNLLERFFQTEEFIKDYYYAEFINEKTNRREEIYKLNTKVLREALVNAFIHSDYIENERLPLIKIYDNKLEIISYGKLNVSFEEYENAISNPRNKVLARVFKDFGLVEEFGIGSSEIKRDENVEIKSFENSVMVTFEINGPIENENEPVERENEPVENKSGPIESESGPIESESGPIESESGPIERESGPIERESGPIEEVVYNLIINDVNQMNLILERTTKGRTTIKRVLKRLQEENKIVKEGKGPKTYYKISELNDR